MFTVSNKPMPVRTAPTRELSGRAAGILATFRTMEIGQSFDIPGVYEEADRSTLRTQKEGAVRDALSECDIKIRAVGTLAGKMAAKLGKSAKVADAGNGAVTVWLCVAKDKPVTE